LKKKLEKGSLKKRKKSTTKSQKETAWRMRLNRPERDAITWLGVVRSRWKNRVALPLTGLRKPSMIKKKIINRHSIKFIDMENLT